MSNFLDDVKQVVSNLGRRSRQGVDSLAVAIDKRTEISKLSGKMRNLNRERGDLVTQIGKKVYGLHGQGKIHNKDVLADCEKIDAITQELGQLRADIEAIRQSEKLELEVPEVEDDTPLDDPADAEEPALEEPAPEEPALEEPPAEEPPTDDAEVEDTADVAIELEAPEEPADDDIN